jgi:hypothetical protein
MTVIAGIGRKPDTVEDRAVNITMRRRMPGESVQKFRLRTDLPELHALRDRVAEWVGLNLSMLEEPVDDLPSELEYRAQDAWEPLIAIADLAGGAWPELARKAAGALSQEASEAEGEEEDIRLLKDIKAVFDDTSGTFFASTDLVDKLRKVDESPWRDMELTTRKLALLLAKFSIKPGHNTAKTLRGYHLGDFKDSFQRYTPSKPSDSSETEADKGKRSDGLKTSDGSNRPNESNRPGEIPSQTPFRTSRTERTSNPDGCDGSWTDCDNPNCQLFESCVR